MAAHTSSHIRHPLHNSGIIASLFGIYHSFISLRKNTLAETDFQIIIHKAFIYKDIAFIHIFPKYMEPIAVHPINAAHTMDTEYVVAPNTNVSSLLYSTTKTNAVNPEIKNRKYITLFLITRTF